MSVTADKTQRTIMIALPFVFVFFIRTFPAGLLLYWITTNFWTVGQQLFVRRTLGQPMPWVQRREAKEAKAEGRPVGPAALSSASSSGSGSERRQGVGADDDAPAPAAPQEEAFGTAQMSAQDEMQEILERIVEGLGLDARVIVEDDGETLTGTVEGDALGLFIGHHGQTIDAVQHLTTRVVLREDRDDRRRIVVDADGYRARRREALEHQADDAADDAVAMGRPVAMDPMSASERRIVHEYLRDREDVSTESEGEGVERHLVVSPVD